ncbi:Mpo1-like protein [Pendulispora albinea]|uniref:DUF962 domain-containing protein n=1 Tax=Pendulispora albinea TaxID=2741071 RepID=A0ABZ2LZU2_9BACT
MATDAARFQSFEDFWPYYVGEHRDPLCRALHYAGTSMAIGTIAAAALTLNPLWLVATPIVGYGPAWVAHFFIEKNRPATFTYPLWSLRGDVKMLGLALRGKMADEAARLEHVYSAYKRDEVAAAA